MVSVKRKNGKTVACAGFVIGVFSSLVGIGGGIFMVLLLLILGLDSKNATPTSAFIITFMAFAGFIAHVGFEHEYIDKSFMLYTGSSAFIGAQTGSHIFKHASSNTINKMFAFVLLLVVGKLWYGLM